MNAAPPRPFRVLVVDDARDDLDAMRRAFVDAGLDAVGVQSGRAAMAVLERETVDSVLADLRLPDLSGLDVLRSARQRHPDMPFVIITAFGTVSEAVAAMKLGAVDFVEKPIPPDDLVRIVRAAVERPRQAAFAPLQIQRSLITDRRVHDALTILDKEFANPKLRLSGIAGRVDVSRYFLARLIKRETGHTFLYHLHARRIHEAAMLLSSSTLTVKEITTRVGYETTGWLDNHFRRFHRMTPKEFRRTSKAVDSLNS